MSDSASQKLNDAKRLIEEGVNTLCDNIYHSSIEEREKDIQVPTVIAYSYVIQMIMKELTDMAAHFAPRQGQK